LSDWHIAANKTRIMSIKEIRSENTKVRSFVFKDRLSANAHPAQFVMVWIPGIDEIPMSLSALRPEKHEAAITAKQVGEATAALFKMKAGDLIGVRGPFGNSYKISDENRIMIVGGGTGLASLAPLVETLAKDNRKITLVMGAKTRADLLFLSRLDETLSETENRLIITTEDGSYGVKGLATEFAEKELLQKGKFEMLYTCGPEKMMCKMFNLTEKFDVPFQASLERFMRCSIGLCGTCMIGKYRVCRDGPVFSGQQLSEVKKEFGYYRLGFDGRQTSV
jgi:dihydroorotate dehydrogenase electron transfer subunit